MHIRLLISAALLAGLSATATAQNNTKGTLPEDREVDMDNPTFVPMVKIGKAEVEGDSIMYVQTNNIYVFPPKTFKNAKQKQQYSRMVYNVKKVLPIAKEARVMLLETYEYLQTLPNKKAKDEHMKLVEKDIKERYTPRMKKLTLTQGKLLIKLIYRECNSSAYSTIKAFLGPVRAGFYQAFAWTFGASLAKDYEPNGADAEIEKIALQVEAGQL